MDRLILPEDQKLEVLFKVPQLVLIIGGHGFRGDSGDFGNNLLDFKGAEEFLSLGQGEEALAGAGLIDDIDRLVWKVSVINVTV